MRCLFFYFPTLQKIFQKRKKELTGSKKCGKILDVRKSGMDLHKENKKDNKQTTQTRCKKSKQ